jgi:hypothetical protein
MKEVASLMKHPFNEMMSASFHSKKQITLKAVMASGLLKGLTVQ